MVLRFARLFIDLREYFSDHRDRLGNVLPVRVVFRGLLENVFKKKRISRQSRGGFGQVTVQLQFAGFFQTLCFVHEPLETLVRALFPLKFELAEQLIGAVLDKRTELLHIFHKDVTDVSHDG